MNFKKIGGIFLTIASCGFTGTAVAAELEVTHWWTSGGESKAVKVIADAFNAGGDVWKDRAFAGSGTTAIPMIVSRIIGGDPMGATQFNHGRQAEELIDAGYMLDLTELANEQNWREVIRPSSLLDSCTFNGRIYCVPINIHSFQWMWLSLDAYEQAGVAPPSNWHEFVASAPQLREAGIHPLAVGTQPWQTNAMFGVIQMGLGGIDLYTKTMIQRDSAALRGETMQSIWKAFGDARDLDNPNNTIQNWNDATNQLITGKAGAQIMGDWAQGEFHSAGLVAGQNYDCLPGLGIQPALDTGGDAFYFPVNKDSEITAAQLRLASLMISQSVQVKFNLAKGSLPVRGDVDLGAANLCMRKGLEVLADPANIVPSADQIFSSDTGGQLNDLLAEFWTNSSLTVEETHDTWATIIESAD